jgi:hypothetical protein
MKYSDLLAEGRRGIYVRTEKGNAVTPFRNENGKTIVPLDNAVLPVDGMYFTNDTINTLPYSASKLSAKEQQQVMQAQKKIASLPVSQQKKMLKTGHQNLLLALDELQAENKIADKNWIVVGDMNRPIDAAALITFWKTERNETIAFIKLYKSKSLGTVPFEWTLSDFAKSTGYSLGNADNTGKNSMQVRTTLNLKPSTVVGSEKSMTAEQIVSQVQSNMKSSELPANVKKQIVQLVNNVSSGFNTPVPGAAEFASAYEVDLGETVAPIALVTGHFVTGSYQEAESALLKAIDPALSWKKIRNIRFPLAGNEALIDSYLNVTNKIAIGVSSKDKTGGAAASLSGIVRTIEQFEDRFVDMKNDKRYKNIFEDISILMGPGKESSSTIGPLRLAVKYKIINENEKQEILAAMDDPNLVINKLSPKLKAIIKDPIYKPNKTNQYTLGYHLMATVARYVTAKMNENSELVTGFFKTVLAKSNLIQVKTKVAVGGKDKKDASYTEFKVIWPPVFEGRIKFYCEVRYIATAPPKGKMGFKIA